MWSTAFMHTFIKCHFISFIGDRSVQEQNSHFPSFHRVYCAQIFLAVHTIELIRKRKLSNPVMGDVQFLFVENPTESIG